MTNTRGHHFLIATLVAQGHLNPCLQLAKRLLSTGATVTIASTTSGLARIKSRPVAIPGLSFAAFTDSAADWTTPYTVHYLQRNGTEDLTRLLQSLAKDNRPVTFLVYNILLPFVAAVGRACSVPSALFFIQSATVFYIYHRFLNRERGSSPPDSVEIPGLPLFPVEDIPSFLFPTDPRYTASSIFHQHILALEEDPCPRVIVNTFDAIDEASIRAVHGSSKIKLYPIGPLTLSNKSYSCDLFQSTESYTEWLDSKPERSVVYVSFGSLAVFQREQLEEIFSGLSDSGRDFLWVLRAVTEGEEGLVEEMKRRVEELGGMGMLTGWCSQVEVLSHPAVGCFVTHCGWNSILESLVAGMPVVACPQFADQTVNAKMVEEVWGTGTRVRSMEREEIRAAVGRVMGGEAGEMAAKWRKLALEAADEDGPSQHVNFSGLLNDIS